MQDKNFIDLSRLDYPEGKEIVLGPQRAIIYERAIEEGYHAGIAASVDALLQNDYALDLLTGQEYAQILNRVTPANLTPREREVWQAYFIAGWVWLCLALPGSCDQENERC